MAEHNRRRTENPSNGRNSEGNGNTNLARMLDKAQEKQRNNLTTKLTKTLSNSLTKMVASILEIPKGSGKTM